jgi:hypothetical protein
MLIYRMVTKLLNWMVLCALSDPAKDIEILVLRHQLAVLQRRTPGHDCTGSTELSSPPSSGCCQHAAALACWSPLPRSCAGTAGSSPTAGPPRTPGPADPPSLRECAAWSYAWLPRTRPGPIAASTANSPDSDTRSAPPPSRGSSIVPGSTPHRAGPDRPGRSSCKHKPRAFSPATCSTSTPSPCTGSTHSSSSSTPPAACTSSASPPTPPQPG